MQWFIISEGRRTGPYSASQLSDLLRQNRISIDSYVLAAGSKIARRLYCSPETLFSEFLPPASTPTQRPSAKSAEENRTLIAPLAERSPLAAAPGRNHLQPAPRQFSPPGLLEGDDLQLRPRPPDRAAIQQLQASPPEQQQRVEHQIAAQYRAENVERQRQLALAEEAKRAAEQREHDRQREALEQARRNERQKEEDRAKAAREAPNKISARSEAEGQLSRRHRKRVYPTHPQKLQRAQQQQKKRSPIPKNLARARANANAPLHQLPKAASEAQMREQEAFNWAKNRVNPTAPRTIHQTSVHRRRKRRGKRANFWTSTEFLITAGVLLIIGAIAVAALSTRQSQHQPVKPRFTVRKQEPQEQPQPVQVQAPEEQPRGAQPPKQDSPQNERPREDVKTRTQKPARKEAEKSTPKATAKGQKSKPTRKKGNQKEVRKAAPERTRNTPKEPARLQTKLPARSLPNKGAVPGGWPSVQVKTGRELAANKFKVVSVMNITLLQVPDSCQPCQIPGKLSDGTKVLLSSQSTSPWKGVITSRTVVVNAKALVTQSAQDYYTLIVQDLSP